MIKQTELKEWADRTANKYDELAKSDAKYDLAFYTQSDLTQLNTNPNVVVMGINPGSVGSYSDQRAQTNEYWRLNGRMDGKHLLMGNPNWENRNSWHYWNRLVAFFALCENDFFNNSVITNASFFNTRKFDELPNELYRKTIPWTIELIDILQPKMVVCLSGKNCFDKIKHGMPEFESRSIWKWISCGKLNGKTYIGVPHPSYQSLTREDYGVIKTVIAYSATHDDLFSLSDDAIKEQFSEVIKKAEDRRKENNSP